MARSFLAILTTAVPLFLAGLTATPAQAQYGGCDMIVYFDANFSGQSWRVGRDTAYVGNHWNDQISSIRIVSGVWDYYFDANYQGEVMRLGPGSYPFVGNHWNDQISSFRCVQPTR